MNFKKILLVFMTVIIMIAFSGCANITCTLNLKQDGKVDVAASVLYSDKEFSYNNESIEKIKNEFEENGFTVIDTNENGMLGFMVEKEECDLNVFNKALDDEFNLKLNNNYNPDDLEFTNGFLYNKYNLNTKLDLTSFSSIGFVKDGNGEIISGEELQKLLSHIGLKLIIKLDKGTITSTNSTKLSADKKSVEWVLIPGTTSEIKMEAITTAVLPVVGTITILAIMFIIAVILLILFIRMYIKRRKECSK